MRDCINLDRNGGADFDMGWLAVADMQERRLCIDVPGQRTALPFFLGFLGDVRGRQRGAAEHCRPLG